MPRSNSTGAAKTRKIENQAKALELRRMGYGYVQIAHQLGVSKSQAHRYVAAGLSEAAAKVAASADELRTEDIDRLDALLGALWIKAKRGEVAAVDRVLKILERRAKLLGIEAPVRIEATGKDGKPIEVSSTTTIDPSKLSIDTLRELLNARVGIASGG